MDKNTFKLFAILQAIMCAIFASMLGFNLGTGAPLLFNIVPLIGIFWSAGWFVWDLNKATKEATP